MSTNYIAPIWRMPRNFNKNNLSNYSIDFSSTASYINVSTNSSLNFGTGDLTYSIWVKADFGSSNRYFVGTVTDPTSNNGGIAIGVHTSQYPSWRVWFSGTMFDPGTAAIVDGQWHHVVLTRSSGTVQVYVDGQVDGASATITTSITNSADIRIGQLMNGLEYWDGEISQFCIFDYALSTDQINYLYNLNNPMAITGAKPVAYLPLGDNSNPNANAGYPNISVGADSVFNFSSTETIRIIDTAPAPTALQSIGNENSYTVTGWINTTSASTGGGAWFSNDTFIDFRQQKGSGAHVPFSIGMDNGEVSFGRSPNYTGSAQKFFSTGTINDGNWHHIAFTVNVNSLKIYIDGSLDSSHTFTVAIEDCSVGTLNSNLQLGARSTDVGGLTSYAPGDYSNFQIWDTELIDTEIQELYNNGQPLFSGTQPQEANLQAWWKLNQSANWEADTVGNWQIPDAVSSYPQSFIFKQNEIIRTPNNVFDGIVTGSNKIGICTISYWLKNKNTGAQQDYMSLNDAGPGLGNSAYFRIDSNNKILYHNGSNYMRWPAPSDLDGWNHYCWVFNSATSYSGTIGQTNGDLQFYLNGEVKAVDFAFAATPAGDAWNGFNIAEAGQSSDSTLDFCMSNLMLYNTNFDGAKVLQLYNNGTPLTTAIATDNLKAWYKLDNTEIWDDTKWEVENQKYPTSYESALNFDDTNDYIDCGNDSSLQISTDVSISCWFKCTTAGIIISKGQYAGETAAAGWNYFLSIGAPTATTTTINWSWYTTSSEGSSTGNRIYYLAEAPKDDVTDGNWHNIVATRSSTASNVWLDGVYIANNGGNISSDLDYMVNSSQNVTIGTASNLTNYFGGELSNIQIWNTVLIEADALSIYNNGRPNTTAFESPISWWKLDNTTTGIQDSVGSNDGTNNGTTKVNTFVSTQTGISSGMTEQNLVNNNVSVLNGESSGMNTTNLVTSNISRTQPYSNYSFNFDNAQADGFNIPSSSTLKPARTLSLSTWVYRASNSIQHPIFDQGQRAGVLLWINQSSNPSTLGFYIQNGSPGDPWTQYVSTGTVLKEQWNHICVTLDKNSGNLKFYINGQDGGGTGTVPVGDIGWSATNLFTIGSHRGIYYFDGKISNTCLFDRVLTEQEVLKIYNNGITQDLQATSSFSNNILGWWPLDEHSSYYDGTDWVVRDIENGNDGDGANTGNVDDLVGNAPGSEASGTGNNLTIADLKGDMYNSDKNAYSINMADYADGVTNPANSGRSTQVPSV